MELKYYVYIMTNKLNTVLYIGVTNDIVRRVYEHKNKFVDGFTTRYNVNKLVYFEIFSDPENAINREKQLKKYKRDKKIKIIIDSNPNYEDLYPQIIQ